MGLGIGFRINVDVVVLGAGAGLPDLLPVDDVMIAVATRLRAHGTDIGARAGLRYRDRHANLTGEQLGQKMALLLLAAIAQQIEAAKHTAAVGHDEIGARTCELFCNDRHVDDTAAQSAVLFRKWQAQQASVGPGLIELVWIKALAIEPADIVRSCDACHQLAHALAQHELFFGEIAVHRSDPLLCFDTAYQTGRRAPASPCGTVHARPSRGDGLLIGPTDTDLTRGRYPTNATRVCSSTSAGVDGCAGNCSTVASWPSHNSVSSTISPSGNSSASW